jgi:hypothetical protein
LSPGQSTPVIYHRPFVNALSPLLPALILLPFLLLKPNRRAAAWLVVAPFGLVVAIAVAADVMVLGRSASAPPEVYPYLATLAGSLGMLCLMTYAMPRWSPVTKSLAIPALFVLPGALVLFFGNGGGKIQNWDMPLIYGVAALVLLAGVTLAGRHCRKHWNLRRFSVLFLAWNFLFLFGFLLLLLLAFLVSMQPVPSGQWRQILMVFVVVLLLAEIVSSVLVFPFIVTAFLSPFYRDRLMAAFCWVPKKVVVNSGG